MRSRGCRAQKLNPKDTRVRTASWRDRPGPISLLSVGSCDAGQLAGQVNVVIDVLHIIAIVQHTDELLEHGQVFRTKGLAGLR